jgi:hypothetical protein
MSYKFSEIKVQKSTEYFNMSDDELLFDPPEGQGTQEEYMLSKDGLMVTYFDDMDELLREQVEFNEYIDSHEYKVKSLVETINERLAVVLV